MADIVKIEKVAKALYDCPGNDFFPEHDIIMRPWDRVDKEIKEHYRIMAKAAIDAYESAEIPMRGECLPSSSSTVKMPDDGG